MEICAYPLKLLDGDAGVSVRGAQRELLGRGAMARLAAGQSVAAGLAGYVALCWRGTCVNPLLGFNTGCGCGNRVL